MARQQAAVAMNTAEFGSGAAATSCTTGAANEVTEGLPESISLSVMPPGGYSRMSFTVIRRLRIHGCPERLSGSILIRVSGFSAADFNLPESL